MSDERPEWKKARNSFDEWFAKNYPGPRTIIGDPHWHSPKILSAALYWLRDAGLEILDPEQVSRISGAKP